MTRLLKDYGLVLVLALGAWLAWTRLFPAEPRIPDQAPAFDLVAVSGERLDLERLRGQRVVLNFWATWCPPCVHEIPEFNAFSAEHPGVAVVGIAVDSGDGAELAKEVARRGITYPVAAADAETRRAYDIRTLPTTVFLDETGQVARVHVGAMDRRALARTLAEMEGG